LIRTPVQRIAVNDQPHEGMLRVLGVEDRIVAVGGHNSYDDGLRQKARSGEIQQIGYGWHMPPTLDALVAARPDVLVARMADLTHTQHLERVESLGIPFVVITVTATLSGFDSNLTRAAASLGAPPLYAFRRVQLPLIAPGVISGALFAFATSFDEVVVVLFMAGVEQRTIPRQMWAGIREQISPAILALATFLIVFAALLLVVVAWLRRRGRG